MRAVIFNHRPRKVMNVLALRASQFTFPLSAIIELLIYFMDILMHSRHSQPPYIHGIHFMALLLTSFSIIFVSWRIHWLTGKNFASRTRKICLQQANIGIFLISLCLNLCNVYSYPYLTHRTRSRYSTYATDIPFPSCRCAYNRNSKYSCVVIQASYLGSIFPFIRLIQRAMVVRAMDSNPSATPASSASLASSPRTANFLPMRLQIRLCQIFSYGDWCLFLISVYVEYCGGYLFRCGDDEFCAVMFGRYGYLSVHCGRSIFF